MLRYSNIIFLNYTKIGQRTTKYLKPLEREDLSFWRIERLCASDSGAMVMEYNDQVTDGLKNLNPNLPEARFIGIRVENVSCTGL